jgi:hypothetical protein
MRRLRGYFQTWEWENAEEVVLAGKPAHRFKFQGEVDNVLMSGECVMLAYRGYAYWLVTWAPKTEVEAAAGEWAALREGFSLLNQREGWTEKQPKLVAVETHGAYTLRVAEGIWEKQPGEGFDEAADVALLGSDPAEVSRARGAATAQFLLLPRDMGTLEEALSRLQDRVLERQKKEGYPETKIEPFSGAPDAPERGQVVGDLPGRMAHLRARNSPSRERFLLLAVAKLPDKMLAIVCECDLQRLSFWEPEFEMLLDNVRRKGR